jgi:large subunit ribosomal protein L5e
MAFVKVVKSPAYFKRYQTKYRRRRSANTDYRARKRLVAQAKDKFNTPKYRLVVRTTNRYCYCQIIWATISGDRVLEQASSKELFTKYGLPGEFGLKNWTACYATGLLIARRVLKKLNLDEIYKGQEEVDGEDFTVEEVDDQPRPFSVVLDVGLQTTSTGACIFGALKGALDGGLSIPHSTRRYPGADKDSMDAELLRNYIFGGHVGEYMEQMQEDDEEKYEGHFAVYTEANVTADNMEETWQAVHEKIREDPAYEKKERKVPAKKAKKAVKMNASQRKDRVRQKIEAYQKKMAEADD